MRYSFTKMHGLGNDFVVFNAIDQVLDLNPDQYRAIADRRFGVGCDQILLVETPRDPETEFHYRIFNADGSEVEQCGNGARCFARFVHEKRLTEKQEIRVGTLSGNITLYLERGNQVRVNMGTPILEPAEIPFQADSPLVEYPVSLDDQILVISAVSMGNPHAVMVVDSVEDAPVELIGPLLEQHPRFPQRVNVGFMEIISREAIRLRVYERGAGETLACGTGACAAVVAGQLRGLLESRVEVRLPGGTLTIEWDGDGKPVWMTGPAVTVFEGWIEL